MNIVFAYHSGDVDLAMESSKAITAMGINMRHKATVCALEGTPKITQITEELKKSFPEVGRIVAQDGFNGWPIGPNQMFSDAAVYCYSKQGPWMFWEPDCVPMKEGWVDDLEKDFLSKPAILGCMYDGGTASTGKGVRKMIVGSSVYPPNFLDFCPLARNLNSYNLNYRSAGVKPEPWDVYCRYEFLKIGRDTPLIRAYWKSVNYHWKDGKIVFYAENPEAQAIQEVTCPDRIISSQAVVIHGCKDGSLHKMAQEGFPMPQDNLVMPSDSTGLERGGAKIPPPLSQGVHNDTQVGTVCDKTSEEASYAPYPIQVLCEAVGLTTREKRLRAVKKDPPKKTKKKRVISEAERERRRQSMLKILARKRERKAQAAV
jgi:hypothetical protein